jgi:hypothetical protein
MVRKPRQFFDLHVKSLVLVFGIFFDTHDVEFVRTIAVLKLCPSVETLTLPGFFARGLQRNALRPGVRQRLPKMCDEKSGTAFHSG